MLVPTAHAFGLARFSEQVSGPGISARSNGQGRGNTHRARILPLHVHPSPAYLHVPMSHCLILQHDPAFGPGRLAPVFRDYGIPTHLTRLHEGAGVPDDFDEVRVLVLLGGTARLTETDDYSLRPDWLDAEVEAIKPYINADRPTLAFGLGAQILAKALGAEVKPNLKPTKEGETPEKNPYFGFAPVTLPFPGGTDPILFGFADATPMFFWHKDAFDLPKLPPPASYDPNKPGPPPPTGNALLASASHCKNAAFRFHDNLYGFAFHPHLGPEDFDLIFKQHGGMAGAASGSGSLDRIKADQVKYHDRYARLGTRLLQNFVQYLHAYDPPMTA